MVSWPVSPVVSPAGLGLTVPLYSALGTPHLECCGQFWALPAGRTLGCQRAVELLKGVEHEPWEEWLRELGLFRLEKRRLGGDLTTVYSSPQLVVRWGSASSPKQLEAG